MQPPIAGVKIRRAALTDAPTIHALVEAAYSHYVPRIGRKPGPMLVDYEEAIPEHQVWVLQDSEGIMGLLDLILKSDHIVVDNLAVAPRYWKRKLGRWLMDFAEREARRQGISELRLHAHQKAVENIAMYHHLGYEETGRYTTDGFPRVFFRKRLP